MTCYLHKVHTVKAFWAGLISLSAYYMFKTNEQISIQFDIVKSTVSIQIREFQGGSN